MKRISIYVLSIALVILAAGCKLPDMELEKTALGNRIFIGWTQALTVVLNTDVELALNLDEWLHAPDAQKTELQQRYFTARGLSVQQVSENEWLFSQQDTTEYNPIAYVGLKIRYARGSSLADAGTEVEITSNNALTTDACGYNNSGFILLRRATNGELTVIGYGNGPGNQYSLHISGLENRLPGTLKDAELSMTGSGNFLFTEYLREVEFDSTSATTTTYAYSTFLQFNIEQENPMTVRCVATDNPSLPRFAFTNAPQWGTLFTSGIVNLRAVDGNGENEVTANIIHAHRVEITLDGVTQAWPMTTGTH